MHPLIIRTAAIFVMLGFAGHASSAERHGGFSFWFPLPFPHVEAHHPTGIRTTIPITGMAIMRIAIPVITTITTVMVMVMVMVMVTDGHTTPVVTSMVVSTTSAAMGRTTVGRRHRVNRVAAER